jgi:hypothetical protein
MSNFAKGQRRSGEIWLSMAKEIYVEEGRKMKTVSPEGKTSQIEMMRPIIGETGEVELENDLTSANFDVDVDVGPSSQSKRAAMVKALTGMLAITDDPQTKQILQSMALMNMEGEGISDIREYFRKQMVRAGVIKPTDEEAQEMQAEAKGRQDPNAIFLQAAAEEATAKAAKARADTVKTIADAELSRAKTAETMAKAGIAEQDIAINAAKVSQQNVIPEPQGMPIVNPLQ